MDKKALDKLRKYCAYQERCIRDLWQKAILIGLSEADIPKYIEILEEENFINQERFAISYARGKFRINQWGKIKIRDALRSKGIEDHLISLALNEINSDQYLACLEDLSEKHSVQALIAKGYEYDEIIKIISLKKNEISPK